MNELYFQWLLEGLNIHDEDEGYSMLCDVLQGCPFVPMLKMDQNRFRDGMDLRELFLERNCADFDRGWTDIYREIGGCTMLELLFVLAQKATYETAMSEWDKSTGEWFMEMIRNIGLGEYTNAVIQRDKGAVYRIWDIVDRVNTRQYEADGEGGIFPLKTTCEDQRDVELIGQMYRYLNENYPIV